MKKQLIAKLLVLAMVLAMVPVTVFAASSNTETQGETSNDSCPNDGCVSYSAPDTTVRVDEPISEDGAIKAKVVSGTATVAFNEKAVESMADLAKDGKIELKIEDNGAKKLNTSFPAKALTAVAKETGADLTISSSVATISIPNEVLSNELGTSGSVKITAQATADSVGFTIQVSGRALKGVKGISVTF